MNPITAQVALPSLGNRSPILTFYRRNLKVAYYLTNFGLLALIFLIFGYIRYQAWRLEEFKKKGMSDTGRKIISLTYAQLGPPPSIQGADAAGAPQAAAGARPSAPVVGVPKPVPDAEAVMETSPDQSMIAGTSALDAGTGGESGMATEFKVDEGIPDINAYVPVDIPPKAIAQRRPTYPDIAKKVGMEGTVFVKMLLDLDGTIMRVVILKSSGFPQLDTAAVVCVSNWKFSPAIQNKKPVRVWLGAPVKFKLE